MNTKMNILFVEPSGAGGIAHYTYCLAKSLVKKNVGCYILTSKRWDFPPLDGHYHVFKLFNGVKTPLINLLKTTISLRHEIDIVHWQSTTHPTLILNLMRVFPVRYQPWVWTVHNVLPHEKTSKSINLYRKIYQFTQGLIFHTHYSYHVFQQYYQFKNKKYDMIPMGEYGFLGNFKENSALSGNEKNIIFFGNIRRYKGLDVLLEAMPHILKAHPETKLYITGQALEPFEYYQDIINKHVLHNNIHLNLAYIPDNEIAQIFSQAQIVALPYRSIDQSAVLLLAMSLGKTVVASNVGGISEVIHDETNGFLVEAENNQALADKIIFCLNHIEEMKKIGQAAKQDVQNRFSWDTIADKTIKYYQDLLDK